MAAPSLAAPRRPSLAPPPAGALLTALVEARLREGALEIPVLPAVASQVLAACHSEQSDARTVTGLVERDQALAAHVLRVANSAGYAAAAAITSLQQAVGRLGLGTVCDLALTASLARSVRPPKGFEPLAAGLWGRAAAASAYAKEIARVRRRNAESVALAGLLHDVGMPVVLRAAAAVGGPSATRDSVEHAMHELHGEVGARLVREWKLPEGVAQAALHHHAPALASDDDAELAWTVHLADRLTGWALDPRHDTDAAPPLDADPVELAALGLYDDDFERLLGARARVAQIARSFT
ncbi:MAG: HDOD domain-containing protein [Polyangiaceae bacterium]|nr:HDOD domain-containing protein [Polyangiaceae bacterium]